ncbi:DUF4184 family protein [Massilia sp. W12]|uniref:DUF4184 family protein n=1 Tax=Massilia sp. W12 TaxID=3126507 RepID=UPI0030CF7CA2
MRRPGAPARTLSLPASGIMPYTLAHPAAVIPLRLLFPRHTSLGAMAIGSMMPDLVFFISVPVTRDQSHSLAGLLWFCLPAGILCWLLLHFFLKPPLLAFMPPWIGTRLGAMLANVKQVRHLSWNAAAIVSASVVLGALTHLIWDTFTHPNTLIADHFAFFQQVVSLPYGLQLRMYNLLQHLSTLLGLSVIMIGGLYTLRRITPLPQAHIGSISSAQRRMLLLWLLLATIAGAMIRLTPLPERTDYLIFRFVVGCMSGFGAGLLLACALWDWRERQRLPDSA